MDSSKYSPKVFGVIDNIKEHVNPIVSTVFSTNKNELKPQLYGALTLNTKTNMNPNIYGVVENYLNINASHCITAVIENPVVKQTHNDSLPISINVEKQLFANSTLPIRITVEHVNKSGKPGDVVGYETNVKSFFTYQFNTQEIVEMYPFFTYSLDGATTITPYPFFTYRKSASADGKKVIKTYYIMFYSNYMGKVIKCRLYDSYKFFPIKDVHMSILCDDNKIRYLPLDKLDSDFDSGVRVRDKFGNDFQVCVARQENVLNKFFAHGNLLIPLTNYSDLYAVLAGLFGKAHVSVESDGVYFSPPSKLAGITKFFTIGLNVRYTTKFGHQITTYDNGLSKTSFGGDKHWMANSMLIKFHHREKFKIEFDDSYYGTSYTNNAMVKNAIVIGESVEGLKEDCSDYNLLLRSRSWYLYDVSKNRTLSVDNNNAIIRYFKQNYLEYPNAIKKYNFYDMQKYKLDKKVD